MIPNLSRTAAALDAYDARDAEYSNTMGTEALIAWGDDMERLGAAFGEAFGRDTVDINGEHRIPFLTEVMRPGPKQPAPWQEENFVRRLVRLWKERDGKEAGT